MERYGDCKDAIVQWQQERLLFPFIQSFIETRILNIFNFNFQFPISIPISIQGIDNLNSLKQRPLNSFGFPFPRLTRFLGKERPYSSSSVACLLI